MKQMKHISQKLMLCCFTAAFVLACETGSLQDNANESTELQVTEAFVAPEMKFISPAELSVGEQVTVMGSNFEKSNNANTLLHVEGIFTPENGKPQQIDYYITPDIQSDTLATFKMKHAYPPNGFAYDVGNFEGTVTPETTIQGQPALMGQPHDATFTINPSVLIEEIRPIEGACQPVVTDTLANQEMMIKVRTIGFPEATDSNPIEFTFTSVAPALVPNENILAGIEGHYLLWVHSNPLEETDQATMDSPFQIAQTIKAGNSAVFHGMKTGDLGDLEMLKANLIVKAEVSDLPAVTNQTELEVHNAVSLKYNGNVKVVHRDAAVLVRDCMPGGRLGKDVAYSDTKTESRSLSYAYGSSSTLGVDFSPEIFGTSIGKFSISRAFNVNLASGVSSSESEGFNLSGYIPPQQFGVFYRQTSELERRASVISRDVCGHAENAGEIILTDWSFQPDLAISLDGECNPPATNLPASGSVD